MPELFQQLSPGYKRLMGGNDKTNINSVYPKAQVCEYWMKDDEINEATRDIWMGPKGAPSGDTGSSPGRSLTHTRTPDHKVQRGDSVRRAKPLLPPEEAVLTLGLYDIPSQEYALSVIGPRTKQQDILNQIMAGVLDCVKKALRPALMAPKSAIHPDALRQIDSIEAEPEGLVITQMRLRLRRGQIRRTSEVILLPVYQMIEKSMKRGSGASAMDDAVGKKQVPGGDTLEKIQFSKTTPIRFKAGNVETGVNEVGELWTATALQFYDASSALNALDWTVW